MVVERNGAVPSPFRFHSLRDLRHGLFEKEQVPDGVEDRGVTFPKFAQLQGNSPGPILVLERAGWERLADPLMPGRTQAGEGDRAVR